MGAVRNVTVAVDRRRADGAVEVATQRVAAADEDLVVTVDLDRATIDSFDVVLHAVGPGTLRSDPSRYTEILRRRGIRVASEQTSVRIALPPRITRRLTWAAGYPRARRLVIVAAVELSAGGFRHGGPTHDDYRSTQVTIYPVPDRAVFELTLRPLDGDPVLASGSFTVVDSSGTPIVIACSATSGARGHQGPGSWGLVGLGPLPPSDVAGPWWMSLEKESGFAEKGIGGYKLRILPYEVGFADPRGRGRVTRNAFLVHKYVKALSSDGRPEPGSAGCVALRPEGATGTFPGFSDLVAMGDAMVKNFDYRFDAAFDSRAGRDRLAIPLEVRYGLPGA